MHLRGEEVEMDESEKELDEPQRKKFLGIWFSCCNVYGRLYMNKDRTHYVGRCPRCMRSLRVKIGEGGTDRRFFRAN